MGAYAQGAFSMSVESQMRILRAVDDRLKAERDNCAEQNHTLEGIAARPSRAWSAERQLRIVAIVFLAALAMIGVLTVAESSSPAKANQSSLAPTARTVSVFKPTSDQMANLSFATVQPSPFNHEVETDGHIAIDDDDATKVYAPFSGRVTKLFARLGDRVEAGAPLFAIESPDVVQAQNDLMAAAATLKSATAQLNLARTNEKREHDLYDIQGAALRDWQQSQSDVAAALANSRNAEVALTSARNRLRIFGQSNAEIAALLSGFVSESLSPEVTIRAPIAGTIIQRDIGLGQYLQLSSSEPVYTIGNLSKVWLVASVREDDTPRIHMGDPVEVRVSAFPGRVFDAKISYIAASIDPSTRRLDVRADVENHEGALRPNMYADFTIITGRDLAVLGVPQQAIVYDGEIARVWILSPKGDIVSRRIQAGKTNGELVEALSGLKAGEKVLTGGAIFIDRAAMSD
jgi:cobalt-zinc-cadmium efflux system membrane fusion protein